MPVKVAKLKRGKYQVSTPNAVHSKGATKGNAMKQRNLLNTIEHNPDFKKMMVARHRGGGNKVAKMGK